MYSIDLPSLTAKLASFGRPKALARQQARRIWQYLYDEAVTGIDQMVEVPSFLRERLAESYRITCPSSIDTHTSSDGNTRKDLLAFEDGARIETVLLRYRERYTVCVSTQVGCACGCAFCATGRMGFVRNLTADEIISQVLHFQRELKSRDRTVSNVVLMGMGEPLLNEAQTFLAIRQLLDPRGLSLAPSRITLSTVGIAHGIERLADLHHRWPIKLAVSLHAATDELRDTLMPINHAYPLERLHEALRFYTETTGRHVLLEWVMIAGVNDTEAQAHALIGWLDGLPAHVNLIRLNPTDTYTGEPATEPRIEAFSDVLDRYHIPHTMRQNRGDGIAAGCGQLTTRYSRQEQLSPKP